MMRMTRLDEEMMTHSHLNRRNVMLGTAGAALALLSGGLAFAAPAKLPAMAMRRNAGCGCCVKWAEAARAAGFTVTIEDTPDLPAVKSRLGVPEQLKSCHTTTVGGYVVEGHVPLDAVKKMLAARPKIRGIAVPGMPHGSPGMEDHGGHSEPFDVLAFDAAGRVTKFA